MAEKRVSEIETLILQLLDEVQEVSIRSIASAAGFTEEDPTKRKAIRRALLALENRHAVEPKGAGRSRVYVRPQTASAGITVASFATTSERDGLKNIPLSIEAKSLLRSISRSLRVRKPVGFNQDFLRAYIPNETLYLSAKTKKQLLTVGRVEVQKRPAGTYARDILSRLLIDLSWNGSYAILAAHKSTNPLCIMACRGNQRKSIRDNNSCAKLGQEVVFLRHQGIFVDRHGNGRAVI